MWGWHADCWHDDRVWHGGQWGLAHVTGQGVSHNSAVITPASHGTSTSSLAETARFVATFQNIQSTSHYLSKRAMLNCLSRMYTNRARSDPTMWRWKLTAILQCVGQLKILLMSPVNVDQHPRTQFILFLLCFMFYCAPLQYHNIKTELENKHNYKWNKGWKEGAFALIEGLMLFDDHTASICNQRSQNLQMFWSHPISKIG